MVERRKILLRELSHILVELEEISTDQEMEEKSMHFVASLEYPWQTETPSYQEHAFEHDIEEFLACLALVCNKKCKGKRHLWKMIVLMEKMNREWRI